MSSWFFTLSKICTETIKNSKNHLLKFNRSQNIVILSDLFHFDKNWYSKETTGSATSDVQ